MRLREPVQKFWDNLGGHVQAYIVLAFYALAIVVIWRS